MAIKFNDISGMKFGSWIVLSRVENTPDGSAKWRSLCSCGTIADIVGSRLIHGRSPCCVKCGNEKKKTHGEVKTRLYRIWHAMNNRAKGTCNKSSRATYAHVDICDEWLDYLTFKEWSMANGYADDLTIDRINNALGYHPSNCRWATRAEQQQNRSVNKFDANDVREIRRLYETQNRTLASLARAYDVSSSTILKIVKYQRWTNV